VLDRKSLSQNQVAAKHCALKVGLLVPTHWKAQYRSGSRNHRKVLFLNQDAV
jgi:hypothetical protein